MQIQKKISTAARLFNESGPNSLARYVFHRGKTFFLKDRWLLGRLVEAFGDKARLDGCTISLDNPVITTRLKSRFLTGLYETGERYLIRKYLARALPAIEIGACLGVLSCIVNRLLDVPESHLAIEANSRLLTTLQKNRDQNNCHFTILNAALAYDTARVQFHISDSALGGSTTSTTSTESIVVPSITLKQSLEHAGFDRTNLICDIEGQEVDLVQREGDILQRHVAWLFVEMHPGIVGLDQIVSTTEDLKSLGFQLVESFGSVQAYCNESIANV